MKSSVEYVQALKYVVTFQIKNMIDSLSAIAISQENYDSLVVE